MLDAFLLTKGYGIFFFSSFPGPEYSGLVESSICVRTSENETTDQIQHTTGLNQRFQWEYMHYINVIKVISDCF